MKKYEQPTNDGLKGHQRQWGTLLTDFPGKKKGIKVGFYRSMFYRFF